MAFASEQFLKNAAAFFPGKEIITRFAPSPTGFLHLGHVVNAIYVWGIAGALGAKVILRMEDHDRVRCKPEYEKAIHQDLAWLGFEYDAPAREAFDNQDCEYRQSNCNRFYEDVLKQLSSKYNVYACDCSRKSILQNMSPEGLEELRYPGFCRDRGLPQGPGKGLRVALPEETIDFDDLRLGRQVQRPQQQCGDLLIRDNIGNWTYQFAVVADDIRHKVNLVIRGQDLLSSTGRQILLMKMMGHSAPPLYFHHGLLTDKSGTKLSKRDFSADIHTLMLEGFPSEKILGDAAYRAGLILKPASLGPSDLPGLFQI